MKFYIKSFGDKRDKREYPCIELSHKTWDDYGKKVLYGAWFYSEKKEKIKIGDVKFLSLDDSFYDDVGHSILDECIAEDKTNYCSLGQDTEFYENIKEILGRDYAVSFLEKIRDLVVLPDLVDDYEEDYYFKNSLVRFSEAERALKVGSFYIDGEGFDDNFSFSYTCCIDGAAEGHAIDFPFSSTSDVPSRIMAIIGENGTGKTQFLSKMALSISGESNHGEFSPARPIFNQVVAVSYSAFDEFKKPNPKHVFSYRFCGIKDKGGFISNKKIESKYKSACDRIAKKKREIFWRNCLKYIIDEKVVDYVFDKFFEKKDYKSVVNNRDGILSSGQSIIVFIVTDLISHIREYSLLLVDEPEIHLHPYAISQVIPMINKILKRFDSYAVVATHSPLVLQNIPSRNVVVFERNGDVPLVRGMGEETFGESYSSITKNAFKVVEVEKEYMEVLRGLANKMSFEEVMDIFDDGLGVGAQIFLRGCYRNEEL